MFSDKVKKVSKLKISKSKFLKPGGSIKRKNLHDVLGGIRQGGICPSDKNSLIFLFSHASQADKFGYHDGWKGKVFHYFGKGTVGNMEMSSLNKSLLNHEEDGRKVYLFQGIKGEVTFENEFVVDKKYPYFLTSSPDFLGNMRTAIVFRLKPVNKYSSNFPKALTQLPKKTIVMEVPLDDSSGESSKRTVSYESQPVRREALLVKSYNEFRKSNKLKRLIKHKLQPSTSRPLETDGWAIESSTLIEAKASASRENSRMAIGQLLDYRKLMRGEIKVKRMAILVPKKPREDLIKLLKELRIKVIFKEKERFVEI